MIAILTFSVPMNMIGLASSQAMDGLNPVSVFRSIFAVLGHYMFLFIIVVLYLCLYVGMMVGVMGWAGPMILEAASKGLCRRISPDDRGDRRLVAAHRLGFYFAYSLGRILGLFTRSYREELDFEL